MISLPLTIALLITPATEGLSVGGVVLGRTVTWDGLQREFPGATCDARPPERDGSADWVTCRVPMHFADRPVVARWLIQPDGHLHAVEFPFPSIASPAAKAVFERQFGSALEARQEDDMLYFGVCRQTALGVFARERGELYVTYTWLEGSRSAREACP